MPRADFLSHAFAGTEWVDNKFENMAVERGSEDISSSLIPPGQAIQLRGGVHDVGRREAFRERAVNGRESGAGLVAMSGARSDQPIVRTMRKRAFPAIIFA